MKTLQLICLSLSLSLFSLLATRAQQPALTQNQEAETRGAFLITRKPTPPPTPRRTPAPRPALTSKAAKPKPTPTPEPLPAKTDVPPTVVATSAAAGNIGLGYTLFQSTAEGAPTHVSPNKTFYEDDAIRVVLEPNVDGYVYIFYTENDGAPQMLFPNFRLRAGDNKITAHALYEVPSREGAIKWFTFDNKPAREKFYLVVTREPLPEVPTGAALKDYCQGKLDADGNCYWQPPRRELLAAVLQQAEEKKLVSLAKPAAQREAKLNEQETEAITRGVKLKPEAPPPDVIYLNTSANAAMIVVPVELKHERKP